MSFKSLDRKRQIVFGKAFHKRSCLFINPNWEGMRNERRGGGGMRYMYIFVVKRGGGVVDMILGGKG